MLVIYPLGLRIKQTESDNCSKKYFMNPLGLIIGSQTDSSNDSK